MPHPCAFRDLSDEAYRIHAETGNQERVDVWLCNWPTTLAAVPPWHKRRVGPGLAIDPDRDCLDCPVRKDA